MGGSAAPMTTNTSSQTISTPWAPAVPYIKQILRQSAKLYSQGGPQYTPWAQVAGFTPQQQAAQQGILNYAQSQGTQDFINQYQGSVANALSGGPNNYLGQVQQPTLNALAGYLGNNNLAGNAGVLNQMAYGNTSNPYLGQQVQGQMQALSNQFASQTLPALRRAAVGGGTFGSSRNALSEGMAAAALDAQSQQLANQMYMGDYQTQEQNRLASLGQMAKQQGQYATNAANLLSGAANNWGNAVQAGLGNYTNALNMPLEMLNQIYNVGTDQYNQSQRELADATARWNYQQQLPWTNLNNMKSILDAYAGMGGTGSSSSMTSQVTPGSSTAGNIGGLLLQMAPMMMGAFSGGGGQAGGDFAGSLNYSGGGENIPLYSQTGGSYMGAPYAGGGGSFAGSLNYGG